VSKVGKVSLIRAGQFTATYCPEEEKQPKPIYVPVSSLDSFT
jgi:hypothetical protein